MNIDEKLKDIMSTILEVDQSLIDEKSNSDSIENWDSLRQMNLILAIEEGFDIEVPDEEVGELTSYELLKLSIKELLEN